MALVPDADLGADYSGYVLELFRFAYNDDQFIADIAYTIWEAEGCPEGQHERHWQMARRVTETIAQMTADTFVAASPADEGDINDGLRPIDYRMLTAIAGDNSEHLASGSESIPEAMAAACGTGSPDRAHSPSCGE